MPACRPLQTHAELHILLVDLLVRQRGGRAYVLQQLEELDGSQAMLPLQLQVRAAATPSMQPQPYMHLHGYVRAAGAAARACRIIQLSLVKACMQLLEFLAAALALPADAASLPQLLEFYAHHHFLHFTRHYHKLATSANAARAAACCKGHVKVRGPSGRWRGLALPQLC